MPWNRQRAAQLAAGLFIVLLLILVQRGLWKGGAFHDDRRNDFHAYHVAAQGVWSRDLVPSYRDPVRPSLYPPTFALLVAPLGLMPYHAALWTWVLLCAALVVLTVRWLDAMLGLPLPALARMAGFLLAYRAFESDFSNGNANVLVLALVTGSFVACRRGRDALGGGILSLAVLCKVAPVLILPWILYRRRWRMLSGLAAGLLGLGGLLPLLALGPRGAGEAWRAWYETTLGHVDPSSASYAAETAQGYEPGQSLRAMVHRLARPTDATSHDEEVVSIHLIDADKPVADGLYLALAASLLGIGLGLSWRRAPGVRLGWQPGEVAAACLLMVLCAPISRKAHFVALLPAAVLGFEAWRQAEGARLRQVGSGLWGLALLLVAGTSPDLLGREAATLALAYCPFAGAALLLLVLVLYPRFFPASGRRLNAPP
jgi:hypothetical protein